MISNSIRAIARERAKLAHGVVLVSSEVMESAIDDRIFGYEYLTEGAKFSILPRFKTLKNKYPELSKYEGLVKESQNLLLLAEETPPKDFGTKCAKIITTVIGVLSSIDSVILLPFCVFIFPVIGLLFDRLIVWACESLQFTFAENQVMNTIQALTKLKNSTTDKKLKHQCEVNIKKLEKELRKIQGFEDAHEKKEQKKKEKAKSYRRESVDNVEEDDIDFMAEFKDEIEDIDVDELVTRLGTVPDTTDEEVDALLASTDPTPITADRVLLGSDEGELTDEELEDLMQA